MAFYLIHFGSQISIPTVLCGKAPICAIHQTISDSCLNFIYMTVIIEHLFKRIFIFINLSYCSNELKATLYIQIYFSSKSGYLCTNFISSSNYLISFNSVIMLSVGYSIKPPMIFSICTTILLFCQT